MRVGEVLYDGKEMNVIVAIQNSTISETEPLERFVARCSVITPDDKHRTLQEVLQERCDEYLKSNRIIEVNKNPLP